ncbi:hypothetical protein, partial [Klebsiella quasipneumoniae]
EGIPAAADIVNLRYKSCSEMEGQDHFLIRMAMHIIARLKKVSITVLFMAFVLEIHQLKKPSF